MQVECSRDGLGAEGPDVFGAPDVIDITGAAGTGAVFIVAVIVVVVVGGGGGHPGKGKGSG